VMRVLTDSWQNLECVPIKYSNKGSFGWSWRFPTEAKVVLKPAMPSVGDATKKRIVATVESSGRTSLLAAAGRELNSGARSDSSQILDFFEPPELIGFMWRVVLFHMAIADVDDDTLGEAIVDAHTFSDELKDKWSDGEPLWYLNGEDEEQDEWLEYITPRLMLSGLRSKEVEAGFQRLLEFIPEGHQSVESCSFPKNTCYSHEEHDWIAPRPNWAKDECMLREYIRGPTHAYFETQVRRMPFGDVGEHYWIRRGWKPKQASFDDVEPSYRGYLEAAIITNETISKRLYQNFGTLLARAEGKLVPYLQGTYAKTYTCLKEDEWLDERDGRIKKRQV